MEEDFLSRRERETRAPEFALASAGARFRERANHAPARHLREAPETRRCCESASRVREREETRAPEQRDHGEPRPSLHPAQSAPFLELEQLAERRVAHGERARDVLEQHHDAADRPRQSTRRRRVRLHLSSHRRTGAIYSRFVPKTRIYTKGFVSGKPGFDDREFPGDSRGTCPVAVQSPTRSPKTSRRILIRRRWTPTSARASPMSTKSRASSTTSPRSRHASTSCARASER